MESGSNYQDLGWVAYKRTSWVGIPSDPDLQIEVRRRDIEAAEFYGLAIHEETPAHV